MAEVGPLAKRRGARRKQRQLNRQTLISMATVSFVVLALLLVVSIKGIELREKNAAYERQKATLQQQIEEEQKRADENVEKIAKEQLGLVKDNEIIFYSGDEKDK